MMADAGDIETGIVENFADARVGEQLFQIGRIVGAGPQLDHMGAVVAGTTHAPLTAMLILFELTDDYQIILPLILATVISSLFARYLENESIYTLKLARRGLRISQGFDLSVLESLRVEDTMFRNYDFITGQTPLGEITNIFQNGTQMDFPVIDEDDQLQGIISLAEIRPVMMQDDLYSLLIASDMMQPDPPYIEIEAPLLDALPCSRKAKYLRCPSSRAGTTRNSLAS